MWFSRFRLHGTVRNLRMAWNRFLEGGGKEKEYVSPLQRGNAVVTPTTTTLLTTSYSPSTRIPSFHGEHFLVNKIVREDIRYNSYSLGQFMSAPTKERRAVRAAKLLAKIKFPPSRHSHFFIRMRRNRTKRSTGKTSVGCVPTHPMSLTSWPPSSRPR